MELERMAERAYAVERQLEREGDVTSREAERQRQPSIIPVTQFTAVEEQTGGKEEEEQLTKLGEETMAEQPTSSAVIVDLGWDEDEDDEDEGEE